MLRSKNGFQRLRHSINSFFVKHIHMSKNKEKLTSTKKNQMHRCFEEFYKFLVSAVIIRKYISDTVCFFLKMFLIRCVVKLFSFFYFQIFKY